MLDLSLMDKVGARPPETQKLIDAWVKYFDYKVKKGEGVNGVQAAHVVRTFRFLRGMEVDGGEKGLISALDGLSVGHLETARKVMRKISDEGEEEGSLQHHQDFARELFEVFKKRREASGMDVRKRDLVSLVQSLAFTGATAEARTHVEAFCRTQSNGTKTEEQRNTELLLWNLLVKGLVRQGDEPMLVDAARAAEDNCFGIDHVFHKTMTLFYAKRNDVEMTKAWYEREIEFGMKRAAPGTISEMLAFSLRTDQMAWCNSVFRRLLESRPDKATWDVIFQWAAGGLGKGVEEVEHMMTVMKKLDVFPDTETFNGLVEFAMSKNDPYLAERYLALALKNGILPNAKTYILQMEYRIDAGDLSGTYAAYNQLQGQEVSSNEDVPVINKYIQALCAAPTPNYDRIVAIAAELDERKVRLTAPTVSALCMLHLSRDETQDVLDILNTHVFHYTKSERASVRDAFLKFCYDRSNGTVRAWEAYTIMRNAFDETNTEARTSLMNEFFARGRSDMATHIFGHMRQHIRPEARPLTDTYVQCFEGIAAAADMESLDMVHNMMKMDSSIDPSTTLYNALMLAYTACEEPYKALDFWQAITNSREGPNYRSLEIVFWVCEGKPFGDENARQIWERMRRMEIEITPDVFAAYVGALAGQALLDECKSLVENSEADLAIKPDWMM